MLDGRYVFEFWLRLHVSKIAGFAGGGVSLSFPDKQRVRLGVPKSTLTKVPWRPSVGQALELVTAISAVLRPWALCLAERV